MVYAPLRDLNTQVRELLGALEEEDGAMDDDERSADDAQRSARTTEVSIDDFDLKYPLCTSDETLLEQLVDGGIPGALGVDADRRKLR